MANDINERLNEAIEKQDWEAVKQIQNEVLKMVKPKRGRPKKEKPVAATTEPATPKKKGRPKGSKNAVKQAVAAEPEVEKELVKETNEWTAPPGSKGFKMDNRFTDDLDFESDDLDQPLTRGIDKRKGKLRDEVRLVQVNCDRCGKTFKVHPQLVSVSIGAGGASGYRCDRCIAK